MSNPICGLVCPRYWFRDSDGCYYKVLERCLSARDLCQQHDADWKLLCISTDMQVFLPFDHTFFWQLPDSKEIACTFRGVHGRFYAEKLAYFFANVTVVVCEPCSPCEKSVIGLIHGDKLMQDTWSMVMQFHPNQFSPCDFQVAGSSLCQACICDIPLNTASFRAVCPILNFVSDYVVLTVCEKTGQQRMDAFDINCWRTTTSRFSELQPKDANYQYIVELQGFWSNVDSRWIIVLRKSEAEVQSNIPVWLICKAAFLLQHNAEALIAEEMSPSDIILQTTPAETNVPAIVCTEEVLINHNGMLPNASQVCVQKSSLIEAKDNDQTETNYQNVLTNSTNEESATTIPAETSNKSVALVLNAMTIATEHCKSQEQKQSLKRPLPNEQPRLVKPKHKDGFEPYFACQDKSNQSTNGWSYSDCEQKYKQHGEHDVFEPEFYGGDGTLLEAKSVKNCCFIVNDNSFVLQLNNVHLSMFVRSRTCGSFEKYGIGKIVDWKFDRKSQNVLLCVQWLHKDSDWENAEKPRFETLDSYFNPVCNWISIDDFRAHLNLHHYLFRMKYLGEYVKSYSKYEEPRNYGLFAFNPALADYLEFYFAPDNFLLQTRIGKYHWLNFLDDASTFGRGKNIPLASMLLSTKSWVVPSCNGKNTRQQKLCFACSQKGTVTEIQFDNQKSYRFGAECLERARYIFQLGNEIRTFRSQKFDLLRGQTCIANLKLLQKAFDTQSK